MTQSPAIQATDKKLMLMNWPERVWIHSPVRLVVQALEIRKWLAIGVEPGAKRVLEIGCGTGRGARLLTSMMGFDTVYAFDLEEKLVRTGLKKRHKTLKERVHFFVGDAQDLPCPDSHFDAVVNFGIIHHVLDWRRCIQELSRVTKPGGVFCFEEIFPPLYASAILGRMLRHP
ncbi:MAG: hypothetical protein QG577_1257, partial [Thermodesulfobacteriota bacterium]|nr:hypothetical protein [Thermodesulfobacteriota bacterium]